MLRNLRSRRRPRYGAQICALASALLLLLSVSLLYSRLSSSSPPIGRHRHRLYPRISSPRRRSNADSASIIRANPLISDSSDDNNSNPGDDAPDKIDEFDNLEDQTDTAAAVNEDEQDGEQAQSRSKPTISTSGYYVDHVTGSIRWAFHRRSIDEWDGDYGAFAAALGAEDESKMAIGSDDVPIDEEVRRKVTEVRGIEDALLLKIGKRVSPLREGWGNWFEKKGDFLRRDRMFKSNLEVLNPLHNPLLQDPDGIGITGLTRGDKALMKLLLHEYKRSPFPSKKPLSVSEGTTEEKMETKNDFKGRTDGKRPERRALDDDGSGDLNGKIIDNVDRKEVDNLINRDGRSDVKEDISLKNGSSSVKLENERGERHSNASGKSSDGSEGGSEIRKTEDRVQSRVSEELNHLFADGKRWGYYPGLHPHLSFSDFVDSFFRKGKCELRVFMVWNSPPWMYSVRHQRGLESLLSHHRDACVLVLSETIELDFFKNSFVKDGYKIAVAMPNLDELLKDTPTYIFASVWSDWRKTKFYPTHYSELVRLAVLYRYGGIYLDSDIVVMNPLHSLNDTIGMEDERTGSSLNGAVMAFRQNSRFLEECLKEFYMTYDDTKLRWNGAELLTRVWRNSLKQNSPISQQELNVQPSYVFFPISSQDITSYFATPASENERAEQDALFTRITRQSLTMHFWNSMTSTLIPESDSLAARLINHPCIRCSDVL
ncbi:unnamed protein product [Linum trigynum]|uniref:Alpha 1,4-glycosyltransferase domain-containing protein n=1 Tax=Linum trigynum TaxID=586398 RepID=A0AAV2FWI0_9ROSI